MLRSPADLIRLAAHQISKLVTDELRAIRTQLINRARPYRTGAALVAGGFLTVLYALAALLVAGGLGLATVLPGWAAALVIGACLLVVSAILLLVGRRHLEAARQNPPRRIITSRAAEVRDEVPSP
ncbi:high-affinity Fe2+/Pb2+ permease [Allocatelliglobosispora scoriae]|uniref:High-affinity Fe2+/Pb2+ permease n=1 Tax=Allocatelliglobosispora scoriae TaxID=643052 RepID=A0A841BIB1_9ACTN|nr:phage holin family protein [Allocatelliglobosispora scoriae]MBB5868857.1 high-affinity Fe2+/Pb2+ permease [Allocatelliglobosispora scoriae]